MSMITISLHLFEFPLSCIAFKKMASVQKFACAWKICPTAKEIPYNNVKYKIIANEEYKMIVNNYFF